MQLLPAKVRPVGQNKKKHVNKRMSLEVIDS